MLGEEQLLVDRAISGAVVAARKTDPDVERREAAAPGLSPLEFSDLVAPSLFAEPRVVVIVVFDGVKQATAQGIDVLVVDTAGRLQNKSHLMEELTKIRRVLGRLNPEAPQDVLLVLDATTGQNALAQVEVFRESAGVTGLIMTKLDGTARGGVLVAAAERFGLPIHAIGVGEKADDLRPFDPRAVARAIAGLPPE